MNENVRIARRKPWLAGLMSLSPGFGQLYNGQIKKALLFYFIGNWVLAIVFVTMVLHSPFHSLMKLVIVALILTGALAVSVTDAVIVARRQGDQYQLKPFNKWYVYLGVFALVTLVEEFVTKDHIGSYVQPFHIPVGSMAPTLLTGDYILVDKHLYSGSKNPQRGDVIVFKYPEDEKKDFIKRVIGLPGDLIEIRNKMVLVNGQPLDDQAYTQRVDPEIIARSVNARDNYGPITVPHGSYFVLGDNRDQSLDSRFFGFVEGSKIRGKALEIYWSWDDKDFRVRWERIGGLIQ